MLDAYGDIILRGWREAVGPCLAEIETNLIQVCEQTYFEHRHSTAEQKQQTRSSWSYSDSKAAVAVFYNYSLGCLHKRPVISNASS